MRYSQGASSPVLTEVRERFDDVRLRRDRVGGDHLRAAERDRLRDRLRALDLAKHGELPDLALHELVRGLGRGDVGLADGPGELLADRRGDRRRARRRRVSAAKRAEESGVRERPPQVLASELGGRHRQQPLRAEPLDELAQPELVEAARGVDQDVAVRPEPGEEVDLVEQRRILDDQGVRLDDRLAHPDRRRRCGRTLRREHRCARSRRSGTPGRAGPRRMRRPRAALPR